MYCIWVIRMASRYKFSEEQIKEIEQARKDNKDKRAEARLKALELRAKGASSNEVAAATGFHAGSVTRLVAKYRDHGIEAISGNHYGGNHRNMSIEEEASILAHFQERAEKGELVEIGEIAKGHAPQQASQEGQRRRNRGLKKIKTSVEALKVIHSEKKIRLMFQDEAGFGRINKPKYCWCGEGIRPSVPCHHIREYRYAYGAVEPMTGDGYFLVMPYCNTVCMNIFLKQLSEHYSEDIILLCCDGAAWHIYTASDRNCRFDEYLYCNERDNSAAKLFSEEYQQSISI